MRVQVKEKKVTNDDNSAERKVKAAAAPNPYWLQAHEWLEFRKVDNITYMFCTWCEKAKFSYRMISELQYIKLIKGND
jgi:hypothetical protein